MPDISKNLPVIPLQEIGECLNDVALHRGEHYLYDIESGEGGRDCSTARIVTSPITEPQSYAAKRKMMVRASIIQTVLAELGESCEGGRIQELHDGRIEFSNMWVYDLEDIIKRTVNYATNFVSRPLEEQTAFAQKVSARVAMVNWSYMPEDQQDIPKAIIGDADLEQSYPVPTFKGRG